MGYVVNVFGEARNGGTHDRPLGIGGTGEHISNLDYFELLTTTPKMKEVLTLFPKYQIERRIRGSPRILPLPCLKRAVAIFLFPPSTVNTTARKSNVCAPRHARADAKPFRPHPHSVDSLTTHRCTMVGIEEWTGW